MTEKDKFLKFFEEEFQFIDVSDTHDNITFQCENMRLILEDDDWLDICFDVKIKDVYLTCITNVKELKKLLKALKYI